MRKRLQVMGLFIKGSALILLLWGPTAKAQSLKVNPYQENVALRFMAYLERKIPDSALLLIEPGRAKDIAYFKKESKQAMKDIEEVIKKTIPSIILVRSSGEMFYRCRYYNQSDKYPDFFQIDIFFADEKSKKIRRVKFYDRKEMIRKQIIQQKAAKEIPPPPPIIKQ